MNFPMSVIPSYIIFTQLYIQIVMLMVAIGILQFSGFPVNIYYLQLIYYLFAAYCLIFSISLITSTLSAIIRDIHMLLNSSLRMFLYISGVLWPISILSAQFPKMMDILKLNPLLYLMDGYRSALFGVEWHFITHWQYTIYFWLLVIVLFLIGSTLHIKFKGDLIDYL